MAQVSKRKVDSKMWDLAWINLISSIKDLNQEKEVEIFLQAILSETEQVMITKRLTAMVMIKSGWSPYQISDVLKISVATAYKLENYYKNNPEFRELIEKLYPKKLKYDENDQRKRGLEAFISDLFAIRQDRSRVNRLGDPG